MTRHAGLILLYLAALPPALTAQDYFWEQLDEQGIKYRVLEKLEQIPIKLGTAHANIRAKYEPAAVNDWIVGSKGGFGWTLKIYEFTGGEAPATHNVQSGTGVIRNSRRPREARNFREFLTSDKDPDKSQERWLNPKYKGKAFKKNLGKSKLPYSWWEFTDIHSTLNPNTGERFKQLFYSCAAVYDLGDREIALITQMPVKRGKTLEPRHMGWAKKMLLSVTLLKEKEIANVAAAEDDKLLRFAVTPARRAAVKAARANIANLENWDIFTTESYIVLYSWPAEKPHKRTKQLREAKDIAATMDRIRELYKQYYPPPEGTVFPYSVMRLCHDLAEFHDYSENTRQGVVGWFSPRSKELVLYTDQDEEQTKAVACHEGWHQYSDTYFPEVELHRWFDEGTGDFFGSFKWNGGRWRYNVNKMRKLAVKRLVTSKEQIALNEIVTWNTDKFYGERASDYYAQGYSMVDFLQRGGQERAPGWDKSWDNILTTYCATVLETRKPTKAIQAAFAHVDWERFTRAWIRWIKDY